jgi:hypothetical protein
MTYIADLAEPGNVKSVGYLARGRNYNQGEVSEEAFDRLVKLVKLHIMEWWGYHKCDLDPCGTVQPEPELYYEGLVIPRACKSDILVPGHATLCRAPSLICTTSVATTTCRPPAFSKPHSTVPNPEAGSTLLRSRDYGRPGLPFFGSPLTSVLFRNVITVPGGNFDDYFSRLCNLCLAAETRV